MRSEAARENSRRLSLEAKRRRTGTCRRCGGETRYNGHGVGASTLCQACNGLDAAERGRRRRGTGSTNVRILALLAQRPARYTEIRDELGLTDGRMTIALNRLMRYGLIVRVRRGVYSLPGDTP